MVVFLSIPIGRATHGRLPSLVNYIIRQLGRYPISIFPPAWFAPAPSLGERLPMMYGKTFPTCSSATPIVSRSRRRPIRQFFLFSLFPAAVWSAERAECRQRYLAGLSLFP